jgi:ABC-2 type transport system permease protein
VQRVQKISIGWGAEQPTESTYVTITLKRADIDEEVVMKTFSLTNSGAEQFTTINLKESYEPNCTASYVLTMTTTDGWVPEFRAQAEGEKLTIQGKDFALTLNFEFSGQDYIWTGLHYWWLAAAGLVLVCLIMLVAVIRYKRNNSSLIVHCFSSLSRYKFLISQLVSRDFKSKYKRSFFGVLWSFLNPLLTTFVMYFVFSQFFKANYAIENFTAYLIIGVTMFNFFSESCSMSLNSIVQNANMISKVYVPKYIYPLTRTLSSGINFALALIPMLIIVLINGIMPAVSWLLVVFPFGCMLIFCFGLGMLLASSMVFFRDTQFLWGVISMMWMYLTPIFYPANIIPSEFSWIQQCNPMYLYISFARTCIISGVSPEPSQYVYCFVSAILMLFIGGLVFKKTQNSFVLYI